jgi:hypothetical protein
MLETDVNKSNFRNIYRNKLAELKINDFRHFYAKINNLKQHFHRMVLHENNARSR